MPSAVLSLFASAGLTPDGVVTWGSSIPVATSGTTTGVYVVAVTTDAATTDEALSECPVDEDRVKALLETRPELRLDKLRPGAAELGQRLASFWLPSEVILYVGLAGPRKRKPTEGELAKRVGEYCKTPLGARSPHAGGWPLKTLATLDELAVHYAYCDRVNEREGLMLSAFATNVAPEERSALHDAEHVMSFANLEHPPGTRKGHGITGAKVPRAPRQSRPARAIASSPREARPSSSSRTVRQGDVRSDVTTPAARTQAIRAGDFKKGIIRIPNRNKGLLPGEKARIRVELRGLEIESCRWDPRVGPDQERSGALGVGKAALMELSEGEQLRIEAVDGGVRLS